MMMMKKKLCCYRLIAKLRQTPHPKTGTYMNFMAVTDDSTDVRTRASTGGNSPWLLHQFCVHVLCFCFIKLVLLPIKNLVFTIQKKKVLAF